MGNWSSSGRPGARWPLPEATPGWRIGSASAAGRSKTARQATFTPDSPEPQGARHGLWRSGPNSRAGPLDGPKVPGYDFGMRSNTKSSITLPPEELRMVMSLQAKLQAKSKVEVVRRGLQLLREVTERDALRDAYRRAAGVTRASLSQELDDLDHLAGEGLSDS